MSLNWFLVIALVCIGLAYTNPDHSRHYTTLSPVFVEFVNSLIHGNPEAAKAAWTFLPKRLAYKNYFLFSTTSFPDQSAIARTPVEGTLTIGLLGQVFVLFPKNA